VSPLGRALGLTVALGFLAVAAEAAPRKLHFTGNTVLNDEVYIAVLDLDPTLEIQADTARLVEERLLTFLNKAGYELAQVEALARDGELFVRVDEGRVEKIVLRGQGSLKTVQARLALNLPFNVFNRPYLERQLERIQAEWGIVTEGYELRPTAKVEHFGLQLDDLGTVAGYPIIPPRSQYELHVQLQRKVWSTGLGVNAGLSGTDGLRIGADYKGDKLFFDGDRYQALLVVGGKLRNRIDNGDAYMAMSRAMTELTWFAPAFRGGNLRPALVLRGEMLSRQRPDIAIETYRHTRIQAALMASYDLGRGSRFQVGLGAEERFVFDVQGDAEHVELLRDETQAEAEPLALANLDLVFDPDEIRRDRRHELNVFARHYPGPSGFGATGIKYQKVFTFGWHDLWLTSKADWLWGDVPFVEEVPVGGNYLRGTFGDVFFVENAAKVGAEFRWSLTRDVYKVSVFNDVAIFGELDPLQEFSDGTGVDVGELRATGSRRIGTSFGAGFHALIAESFQLDLYYAFGYTAGYPFERGIAIALKQAF
jgi:hypothetical protein